MAKGKGSRVVVWCDLLLFLPTIPPKSPPVYATGGGPWVTGGTDLGCKVKNHLRINGLFGKKMGNALARPATASSQ